MRFRSTLLKTISLLILLTILMTACSGGQAETQPSETSPDNTAAVLLYPAGSPAKPVWIHRYG